MTNYKCCARPLRPVARLSRVRKSLVGHWVRKACSLERLGHMLTVLTQLVLKIAEIRTAAVYKLIDSVKAKSALERGLCGSIYNDALVVESPADLAT